MQEEALADEDQKRIPATDKSDENLA